MWCTVVCSCLVTLFWQHIFLSIYTRTSRQQVYSVSLQVSHRAICCLLVISSNYVVFFVQTLANGYSYFQNIFHNMLTAKWWHQVPARFHLVYKFLTRQFVATMMLQVTSVRQYGFALGVNWIKQLYNMLASFFFTIFFGYIHCLVEGKFFFYQPSRELKGTSAIITS